MSLLRPSRHSKSSFRPGASRTIATNSLHWAMALSPIRSTRSPARRPATSAAPSAQLAQHRRQARPFEIEARLGRDVTLRLVNDDARQVQLVEDDLVVGVDGLDRPPACSAACSATPCANRKAKTSSPPSSASGRPPSR